ncbi:MAG TPA: phosphatase PAP2 family protein [Caulobacteraceae bacterium]|jgi:undecaprenyl-diphosphatase
MLPMRMTRLAGRAGVTSAWELARREAGATAALLVLALCAWTFLGVADEVREGETAAFDRRLLLSLRTGDGNEPVGPHWLEIAAADLTALGSIAVLALLVLMVSGLFAALRRRREALVVLLASGGGILISQGLKQLFGRERPDAALRAVEAMNPSFPSGHAMLSAAVFLTLGALSARYVRRKRVKAYIVGAAVTATLLVGCTRVYLGVHWPSDVLAGWVLGAAWAMVCWLGAWAWDRPWRAPRVQT